MSSKYDVRFLQNLYFVLCVWSFAVERLVLGIVKRSKTSFIGENTLTSKGVFSLCSFIHLLLHVHAFAKSVNA